MTDDPDPFHEPPSRDGLLIAGGGMLAGMIVIYSWLGGWRPW